MAASEEVLLALRRIARRMELHSKALEQRYGVTAPQLSVLRALQEGDGQSVGELTRAVLLSQATVTGILERLEKHGLVVRRRGEADRRRVLVWLSERGRDVLRVAPPALRENFSEAFERLADWERTLILSSLQRVAAMMENDDVAPVVETPTQVLRKAHGPGEN